MELIFGNFYCEEIPEPPIFAMHCETVLTGQPNNDTIKFIAWDNKDYSLIAQPHLPRMRGYERFSYHEYPEHQKLKFLFWMKGTFGSHTDQSRSRSLVFLQIGLKSRSKLIQINLDGWERPPPIQNFDRGGGGPSL